FVVDVAVALFGVSLAFSIQLSFTHLELIPTMVWYRRKNWRHSREWHASLAQIVLNLLCLLLLGIFWYYRGWMTSGFGGFCGFMFYLIIGSIVGVSPWFAYWGTRKIRGQV
ncbi:MAG: hypothetical protein WCC94_06305, partial [Candidatus Bathyarchaeia archaeon]